MLDLAVEVLVETSLRLPVYRGDLIRSAFGYHLRGLSCVFPGKECSDCQIASQCVYLHVFETSPRDKNCGFLCRAASVPQPFAIEPPLVGPAVYKPGSTITWGLKLFGRGARYAPYLIAVLERMGQRGFGRARSRYSLSAITNRATGSVVYTDGVFDESAVSPQPASQWFSGVNGCSSSVEVVCRSPLRIQERGRLVEQPGFDTLMKSILIRFTSLATYHGVGGELDIDAAALLGRASTVETVDSNTSWYDVDRFSRRQMAKMSLGGVLGSISYSGDLDEFLPWLRLGGALQVGRATTSGLGVIDVKEVR